MPTQAEQDRRIGELSRRRREVQEQRNAAQRACEEHLDALKKGTSLIFDVHPRPRMSVAGATLLLGDVGEAVTWPSWEQVRDAAKELQDTDQELATVSRQLKELGA